MNKLGKHGMSVPTEIAYPFQVAISENGVNDEIFHIYNRAQWEEFVLADRKAYSLTTPPERLALSSLHDQLARAIGYEALFGERSMNTLVFSWHGTGNHMRYELSLMA